MKPLKSSKVTQLLERYGYEQCGASRVRSLLEERTLRSSSFAGQRYLGML